MTEAPNQANAGSDEQKLRSYLRKVTTDLVAANRRTFLGRSLTGLGSVALASRTASAAEHSNDR